MISDMEWMSRKKGISKTIIPNNYQMRQADNHTTFFSIFPFFPRAYMKVRREEMLHTLEPMNKLDGQSNCRLVSANKPRPSSDSYMVGFPCARNPTIGRR